VPVTCPNCGNRFTSPVLTIVDVSQNPEAKALFLSGRINIAVCPQCGNAGMLSSPLVYHDADKELLLTYAPSDLGLPEIEQQRVLGDLTNRVMSSLPPEKRKGYLLRPRNFLRLEALIEAILEADGITPEMLQAQRAKAALLERLVQATDEGVRRSIVQENDGQIDYEFFQLLELNIELAQTSGRDDAAHQLLALRQQLLDWTTTGQEVASREEAIRELGPEITREALLDKLVAAALARQDTKVETMVAFARPAIDYIFYQQLTARIESAAGAGKEQEAETLKALRETILDLTAEIDAEMEEATREVNRLLDQILGSPDLEQALHANLDRIDDLFLNALALRLQAAEQGGRQAEAEKLGQIRNLLVQLIEESQPAEIRFINQLLGARYPDETLALLEENRQQVDAELLELMDQLGEDLNQNGRSALALQLARIQEQAAALVQ